MFPTCCDAGQLFSGEFTLYSWLASGPNRCRQEYAAFGGHLNSAGHMLPQQHVMQMEAFGSASQLENGRRCLGWLFVSWGMQGMPKRQMCLA